MVKKAEAIRGLRRASGDVVALDDGLLLGRGGEARVYALPGDASLVAKLYHRPTVEKRRKLELMIASPPVDPATGERHPSLTWPTELLHEEKGDAFAGFLMPRLKGFDPAFELYNPATRREKHPGADWGLLVRAARNLAAVAHAVHERGYVIGDINETNTRVSDRGAVMLIDCDSFRVPDPTTGSVFLSPVAKPEFTAPELQGKSLAVADQTLEDDLFGLGVLIFLFLMEGTHPFAGEYSGPGDIPMVGEAIRRGLFPYGRRGTGLVCPRRTAPAFELLHPGLRALAVRCFEDGHDRPKERPSAASWRDALADAELALAECGVNRLHRFGSHLKACPWCERTAQLGGRDPYAPSSSSPTRSNRRQTSGAKRTPQKARSASGVSIAPATTPATPAPAARAYSAAHNLVAGACASGVTLWLVLSPGFSFVSPGRAMLQITASPLACWVVFRLVRRVTWHLAKQPVWIKACLAAWVGVPLVLVGIRFRDSSPSRRQAWDNPAPRTAPKGLPSAAVPPRPGDPPLVKERFAPKTGYMMAWVPPGKLKRCEAVEKPVARSTCTEINVPGFWLGRTEVSRAVTSLFFTRSRDTPAARMGLPVVEVDFDEAQSFCAYLGGKLPSDVQWERAAVWDPLPGEPTCEPTGEGCDVAWARAARNGTEGTLLDAGANRAGVTRWGHFDMLGNVWEWTASRVMKYSSRTNDPLLELRGGSFRTPVEEATPRAIKLWPPFARDDDVGFRCAWDFPGPD